MTPGAFLNDVVRPNVADFHQNFGDLRLAHNAVASVDALAAHLYVWLKANAPNAVSGIVDDSAFRAELANRDEMFRLLRDIAKAQKHVHLTRHNPLVTQASQVASKPVGWGEGGFGQGRYGGPIQVVVDLGNGRLAYVEEVVDGALALLEQEILANGI
ncbi:MAG: hypothetical protein ACXW27_04375 [Allosphingosinicella sp.]